MNKKTIKYRYFTFVLYPDNSYHASFIDHLSSYDFKAVYILHDRDCDSNGELKKAHWHVVLKLNYAISINSAIDTLCPVVHLPSAGIEPVHSLVAIRAYLTHSDSDSQSAGKFKYLDSDIRGDLCIFGNSVDSDSFSSILDSLCDWLYDPSQAASWASVMLFLEERGLLKSLMRYGYMGTKVIDEFIRRRACMASHASDIQKELESSISELSEPPRATS